MPHVTFIHGIANKDPEDELLQIWQNALAASDGLRLATKHVTSSMVYWADVLYEKPSGQEAGHESVGTEAVVEAYEDLGWAASLEGEEKLFAERLTTKLGFQVEPPDGDDEFEPPIRPDAEGMEGFERIPLPWFVKRRLMKVLLRDVHHYLFNVTYAPRPGDSYVVQDEIRKRFVEELKRDREANPTGPHVVVSHSMGTVIAFDCLKRVADCPPVDGLMTIGSPLGLDEIQDKMKPEWSREDGFPEKVYGKWINVYDKLDPVAGLDPVFSNDYRKASTPVIIDINEQSHGKWRHSIDKYLGGEKLRRALADLLGVSY